MANIKSSYDLEHLSQNQQLIADKGAAKKIYLHLHKALKGEDAVTVKEKRKHGPLIAPG